MNKRIISLCAVVLGAVGTYGIAGVSLKADDQRENAIEATMTSSEISETSESETTTSTIDTQSSQSVTEEHPETTTTSTKQSSEETSKQSSSAESESTEATSSTAQSSHSTSGGSSTEESLQTGESATSTASSTSRSSSTAVESTTSTITTTSNTISTTPASADHSEKNSNNDHHQVDRREDTFDSNDTSEATAPSILHSDIVDSVQPSVTTDSPISTYSSDGPNGISDGGNANLDKSFLVSEMAQSDLLGYELPLLNSFKDKNQAVLIYEGIKQVGKIASIENTASERYSKGFETTEDLFKQVGKELFDNETIANKVGDIAFSEKQAGDFLYKNNNLIGLYLGSDYYLCVKEKDKKKIVTMEKIDSKQSQQLTIKHIGTLTLTEYGKKVEKSYPASFDFQRNNQTDKFIEEIGKSAQSLGEKYDVFASVMIAQAILESGSGTSELSRQPNFNLFGMKGSYNGNSVIFATQEDRGNGDLYTIQDSFRKYSDYAHSLEDYVKLIRGGIQGNDLFYKGAWRSTAKNYLKTADFLTGKYATDTEYNRKLSSLIATYHLTQFDKQKSKKGPVGQQTSAIMQGKDSIPKEYREKMRFPDYDGKNYNTSGSYPVGQCTWYAFNRVAQLGKHVDEFMGNGGEWGQKGKALGYKVTQEPTAGYLVSFTPGTAGSDPSYGHVAFVEAVGPDGILISEGNVVGGTIISYRVIPNSLARSNLVSYIEPK